MPFSNSTGQFGVSNFVVGPLNDGSTPYGTDIQSAVNDAAVAGGTVFIRPGTYIGNFSFPAGITVQAAVSSDPGYFPVIIQGKQTYNISSGSGSLTFQGIYFHQPSLTGIAFAATNSGSGSVDLGFNSCKIDTAATDSSPTLSFQNTGSGGGTLSIINSQIYSNYEDIAVTDITVTASNDFFGSTFTNIGLNSFSIFNGSINTFLSTSGNNVVLSNSSYNSGYSNYISFAGSAFSIDATSSVESAFEEINSGGTYFATGVAGGSITLISDGFSGTSSTANPALTKTIPPTTNGSGPSLTWSDVSSTGTVTANSGSFVTAAITLTLPASPSQGNACSFVVDNAGTFVLQPNSGQYIRYGNQISSLGALGSLTNGALGDSISLIYRASDTTWITTASQGNWTIT